MADQDDQTDEQNSSEQQINSNLTFHQQQQQQQHQQHRANTTMHVCWHRNTSVGILDNHRSTVNQLSGYLLRKFKNSNGWQKLWVVFTNFCLFFYKTYQVKIMKQILKFENFNPYFLRTSFLWQVYPF